MKNRVLQIALRVALIKEEFTESEILEAIKLLEEQSSSSALLVYLSDHNKQTQNLKEPKRKSKPSNRQQTKVVMELESKDPEKFKMLSDFEESLQQRKVLPKLNDVKKLGMQLSKNFVPKKSRQEVIKQLMPLLADKSIEEIEKIVKKSVNNENEYQRLAQFIIDGKISPNEDARI